MPEFESLFDQEDFSAGKRRARPIVPDNVQANISRTQTDKKAAKEDYIFKDDQSKIKEGLEKWRHREAGGVSEHEPHVRRTFEDRRSADIDEVVFTEKYLKFYQWHRDEYDNVVVRLAAVNNFPKIVVRSVGVSISEESEEPVKSHETSITVLFKPLTIGVHKKAELFSKKRVAIDNEASFIIMLK